jgi:transcriptional regulator with XRE-family HTH domain
MPHAAHAPAYRQFLKQLRSAREGAGLLQVEVARRLRKPQSYVSKCESGERRVDVVELAAFAAVYRVPITYFLPTPRLKGSSGGAR